MENRSKICNIVPSPHDDRDWEYEARVASAVGDISIPETFRCSGLTPVKNQGSRGTCVAMTLSCVKEYQEGVDNPEMKGELMSPNSLYIYRTTKNGGMYCRSAMSLLKKHGMCTEHLFPYSKKKEPTIISDAAKKEALNYRIKSYARVHTIEGAKKALLEYGPLLIAFPYYKNGSAQFWIKPTVNKKADGGHAVAIIGWDRKGFIIRNSWGYGWNKDGHVHYPFTQWGSHWEIWSSIDEETDYIPDRLKNKPDPLPDNFIRKLGRLCGKRR